MRNLQENCFLRICYNRSQGEFVVTGTNPHVTVFEGFIIQKVANVLDKIFQTDELVASYSYLDYRYKLLSR